MKRKGKLELGLDAVPLTLGFDGPRIGRITEIEEDERGLLVKGEIVPSEWSKALYRSIQTGDIRHLSFFDPRVGGLYARSRSRRQRLTAWRRSSWYALREALAKLVLPDGPWDDD